MELGVSYSQNVLSMILCDPVHIIIKCYHYFRCLRVTDPNDPVLQRAARESGNPVSDIIENLPADLAIWIDPGEVGLIF